MISEAQKKRYRLRRQIRRICKAYRINEEILLKCRTLTGAKDKAARILLRKH